MPQTKPISEWSPDFNADRLEIRRPDPPNDWMPLWAIPDKREAKTARHFVEEYAKPLYRVVREEGDDVTYFASEVAFEKEKASKVPPGWGDI